jgi:adenosylmethionine-8-amino-7-oxononanoate aminotransferase
MEFKKYDRNLTDEQKKERRAHQLKVAQEKYKEKNKKEKVVKEKKEKVVKEKKEKVVKIKKEPTSYSIDYLRDYHKKYYENNRDIILNRSKAQYKKN